MIRSFKETLRFILFSFLSYLTLFIFIFYDVVFKGATFAKRDIWRFYFPVWHFVVETMKSGIFPLWNPYNSYGAPFFADIQTCILYPFSLILYLPNYLWAFNFYILLHLALAATFCAVWMKECRSSDMAAFLSGLAYGLGGYVMSAISLTISLASLVYFPLVLLSARRAFSEKRFFWKGVTSLVLVLQYLAGDPAVLFATLVVLTVTTAGKTAEGCLSHKKPYLKYVFDLIQIVMIFVALSLFHTLLFFEFLMRSNRATMGLDAVTMWSLQYNDVLSLIFPYFSDLSIAFMDYWTRQSWLENAYAGVVTILLAFASLKLVREDRNVKYHVLLALFGLALCLGRFSPIYHLFYHGFPFFKFIRYPARFLFLSSFSIACLAGFGLDYILRARKIVNKETLSSKYFFHATLLLAVTVSILVSMVYSDKIAEFAIGHVRAFLIHWSGGKDFGLETTTDLTISVLANVRRTMLLVCFFAAGVIGASYLSVRKSILAFYFILLIYADLVGTNVIEIRVEGRSLSEPGKNVTRILQDPGLFRFIASPESVKLQYEPRGRETLELTMHALTETLTPNLLLPYHISDVSGYDSIFTKESIAVNGERRKIQDPLNRRFYDMLNIRYMVSPREDIHGQYQLVEKAHPVNLYQNQKTLPRAFLVSKAEIVLERESILKRITAADYDPESTLFLDEDPGVIKPGVETGSQTENDGVEILRYTPNEVRMSVRSGHDQWLFFSDMYYPGWKATVNSQTVKIHRANYAFRTVRVPAGNSIVEWKYDPILFRIGSGISLLTAMGLAVYFIYNRRGQNI